MSVISETIKFYKEKKREEKQKKELLNSKTDISMLEKLVQKCNDNPMLKIAIFMTDGTRYELTTYSPQNKPSYLNINGYEEIK